MMCAMYAGRVAAFTGCDWLHWRSSLVGANTADLVDLAILLYDQVRVGDMARSIF